MNSLSIQPTAREAPQDAEAEAARLEELVGERKAELGALQERFRDFKARYAQVVGSRLVELSEVEAEIRAAEARRLGLEEDEGDADEDRAASFYESAPAPAGKSSLRKLFWSVARLFHPDHAADEREAERRHSIMAEASRAYRDGDVDSLHTLLGDEQLQFYCASASQDDEPADLATRVLNLKEELRTADFGIKRIPRIASTPHAQIRVRAAEGRATSPRWPKHHPQIAKARRRLEHNVIKQ